MKDYYRILGISEDATEQQIKLAYRRLAKRYHPDLNPGDNTAEERFKEILEAYTTLSDPQLKISYDFRKKFGYAPYSGKAYTGNANTATTTGTRTSSRSREDRRKKYSDEDLAFARAKHKSRVEKNISRRKKILKGMIITFALYLAATVAFELYLERKREREAAAFRAELQKMMSAPSVATNDAMIHDLDSPYDSIFGSGMFAAGSPNELLIANKFSDMVVCLVEADRNKKTIRNEFIHKGKAFSMKEIPGGNYMVKIYTGTEWIPRRFGLDTLTFGGFNKNEHFYFLKAGPFLMKKDIRPFIDEGTKDTLIISNEPEEMIEISRDVFFQIRNK
ncbi:MAG: hypothetical protein Fur0041_05660 [Bacteroidia bacterium]